MVIKKPLYLNQLVLSYKPTRGRVVDATPVGYFNYFLSLDFIR